MGHARAILGGEDDTTEAKKRILRACGDYTLIKKLKSPKPCNVLGLFYAIFFLNTNQILCLRPNLKHHLIHLHFYLQQ